MKKYLHIFFFFLFISCGSNFVFGQTTLYSENFEGTALNVILSTTQSGWLENPTTLNSDWGFSNTGALAGSRSLEVKDSYNAIWADYNWNQTCNMRAYNTSTISAVGYNTLLLNFKWKAYGEPNGATPYDYGMITYSFDNITWTNITTGGPLGNGKYVSNSAPSTVTVTNFALPAALNNSTFYFGFRWINDAAAGNAPGFIVDDISITATPNNSISTSAISGSPFCAGGAVSVPFTSTGTFTAGNIYTAQLSNSAGSFAAPTSIGTLSSTANSGTIAATIPGGQGAGTLYRIRVVSSAPVVTGTDNGSNLTINVNPTVANAGADQNLCNTTTTTLAGNTATVGTGAWSVVSGAATITTPSSPTSGVAGLTIGGSAILRWTIANSPCLASTDDMTITVSAPSVLGTVSPVGPIDFCNSGGDWTAAGPMTVSGNTGTITWDWGSNNGVWNNGWTTGVNPGYCCFPKKLSASDGNPDRIRWSVTNGGCPASAFSASILIRNHYNEAPTSLTASANPICSGTGITLTANFPAVTNMNGNVEFYSGSCLGALIATVAGNGTTSVSTAVTPPLGTTTYYARYNPGAFTGCAASGCVSVSVTADAPSVLGTVSPVGNIDFCDATGNWTAAGPMTVSGNTGTITWDWGSSNGTWNNGWTTGANPGYCCFPKKVAASDANADRIRWSTKNGACAVTAVSSTILIRNHYNEAPTSLTCNINNVCAGAAGTLTANFPTATNISGNVEFFTGSCAGTLIATVAGNGTTSVSFAITAPASSVTYYARYNPGAGAGCAASACVNVTLTVLPATPATPGAITGAAIQCPSATNQFYSISAVTNATTYTWVVPAGWTITAGQGTTALTVTSGGVGQNGNITVTAGNSCGTSAASTLAVSVVAGSTPVAGPDQYICSGTTTATMAAANTGSWSYISGPAGYTITTPSNPTTTITGLVTGTYEFRWTSCGGAYDDMVIVRQ